MRTQMTLDLLEITFSSVKAISAWKRSTLSKQLTKSNLFIWDWSGYLSGLSLPNRRVHAW
jgi:hypothetical protein